MKKILLGIAILLLITPFSYCQEPRQPIQLLIKSDKQVYEAGEEIKLSVTLKNNSNKEMIVYWSEADPAIVTKETNVFTVVVDASSAKEVIYIKPKETFEKYISINFNINLGPGPCSITMEYIPVTMLDHKINIEKQAIWNAPLSSNTIIIEVKEKESKKAPLDRYCKTNEDCKWVRDYCGCQDRCVNKFLELENCPADNKKCKFGGFDTLICYCVNNKCVEGPKE